MTTVFKTVEVEVDVDMSDFSDKEITEEYNKRFGISEELNGQITEMFYAFQFGKQERAIAIAKKIAQDVTGRIL